LYLQDQGPSAQQASQQTSNSSSKNWQCCSTQAAYKAALLQYGHAPCDLQQLISTFAAAVLRVSQSFGSAAGQLLQQRAFCAAEQVHSQLGSLQRDQQLLAVAREALACAAVPAACLQEPETASQQSIEQLLQDPLLQPLRKQSNLSWRQTLQQLHDWTAEEDGGECHAFFSGSSGCSAFPGHAVRW
jgi:hypothetical protein